MGRGMPKIDHIKGGFVGGIRTKYRSFFPLKFHKTPTYDRNAAFESEDEYNNRPPPYSRNNYYQQERRRPTYHGIVKFT